MMMMMKEGWIVCETAEKEQVHLNEEEEDVKKE